MNLLGRTISSTSLGEARFLEGQNVLDALTDDSNISFGGGPLKLFFEDHTYLHVEIVADPDDEKILGMKLGEWRDNNGVIEELT